jgi:hypothetical protein
VFGEDVDARQTVGAVGISERMYFGVSALLSLPEIKPLQHWVSSKNFWSLACFAILDEYSRRNFRVLHVHGWTIKVSFTLVYGGRSLGNGVHGRLSKILNIWLI